MTTGRRTVRRPGPAVRTTAPRRRTAWDDEYILSSVVHNGQHIQLLAQNVADPEKRGCTMVRLIYHGWFQANSPGAVNGTQWIAIGIGLTSDDAFAAGAVSEADTADDFPVSGWVMRETVAVMDSIDAMDQRPVELFRDLRVARKLERSSLFITHESNAFVGTTQTVGFLALVRVLYKLP